MRLLAAILIAYLIGSISFAVLVSRAFGLPDPRSYGSGNPGATNVLRTGRKAAAVAVVAGHLWPLFFRFEGGKGVSTAVGVLLALDPWLAAGAIATWCIIAFFFRTSSLAALVAAAFAPFFSFLLYGMNRFALEPALGVTVISLLLVWRHRTNIRNLLAGTESRIGGRGRDSPG